MQSAVGQVLISDRYDDSWIRMGRCDRVLMVGKMIDEACDQMRLCAHAAMTFTVQGQPKHKFVCTLNFGTPTLPKKYIPHGISQMRTCRSSLLSVLSLRSGTPTDRRL